MPLKMLRDHTQNTLLVAVLLGIGHCVSCFDIVASGPPLLNVPVYALATGTVADGSSSAVTTNMSIVTYASPVSVHPERLWAIGLYKETFSYQLFAKSHRAVLQLLTPAHIPLIRLLGGSSGREVDKREQCRLLGFEWESFGEDQPMVLPGCASYVSLELGKEGSCWTDGGSHQIALCRASDTFTDSTSSSTHLDTKTLRDLGIITDQGRVPD